MQNSATQILDYDDLRNAVKTIDKEIETLNILKRTRCNSIKGS